MHTKLALLSALLVFSQVVVSQVALAHPDHEASPMPKDFETLKKLVGTWEGTSKMHGDKEQPVSVVYELTSGGTVIMEKLMPGTPHEMVSIYHKEGNGLAMTHYCSMGNHPTMVLTKADDKMMAFQMTKPTGVSSMNEMHMHAVTLKMSDANTLEQDWVSYNNGKPMETAVFNFKRKI